MSIPIVCYAEPEEARRHRFSVASVSTDLVCIACGSADIDLDEARVLAEAALKVASEPWAGDGSDGMPYVCEKCGKWRNAHNCPHCDAAKTIAEVDQQRGPTILDYIFQGLFPSGNAASKTAEIDPASITNDDVVTMAHYMADSGYSADEVAYMVEKPWKFVDVLEDARKTGAKTADYTDPEMGEVGDTASVTQQARCSTCLTEHQVTVADPAQPLPACPSCGSETLTVAGATLASRRTAGGTVKIESIDGPGKDGIWPSPAVIIRNGVPFLLHGPTGGEYFPGSTIDDVVATTLRRFRENGVDDITLYVYSGTKSASRRTASKFECSGCNTPYDLNRNTGRGAMHIPSNRVRGDNHVPAHDVPIEASTDGALWGFECPACGYWESQYDDPETAKALGSLADDVKRQFDSENPSTTEGCDVCGDSGHTTAQHKADPKKYDDATRTSRRQAAFRRTAAVQVHTFGSTGEAYDASQTDDSIHDGDVLAVPSEGVYGFLQEAWPVVVVPGPNGGGEFHTLLPGWTFDMLPGGPYTESVAKAKEVAGQKGASRTASVEWETYSSGSWGGIYRAMINGKRMEVRSQENGMYWLVYNKDLPLPAYRGSHEQPVAVADSRADAEAKAIAYANGPRTGASRVRAKIAEIAGGVLATNPGMNREAALDVAARTLRAYPAMIGN